MLFNSTALSGGLGGMQNGVQGGDFWEGAARGLAGAAIGLAIGAAGVPTIPAAFFAILAVYLFEKTLDYYHISLTESIVHIDFLWPESFGER